MRRAIAELVEVNPDNPRYRGHLGFVELSLGNHAAAIAHFERVAADDFDPAVTHYNLASAHAAAGNDDRARAEMEAVIGFDATFAWAYDWLAVHHESRGEFGRAAWWRGEQLGTGRLGPDALPSVAAQRDRLAEAARAAGQDVRGP